MAGGELWDEWLAVETRAASWDKTSHVVQSTRFPRTAGELAQLNIPLIFKKLSVVCL